MFEYRFYENNISRYQQVLSFCLYYSWEENLRNLYEMLLYSAQCERTQVLCESYSGGQWKLEV